MEREGLDIKIRKDGGRRGDKGEAGGLQEMASVCVWRIKDWVYKKRKEGKRRGDEGELGGQKTNDRQLEGCRRWCQCVFRETKEWV